VWRITPRGVAIRFPLPNKESRLRDITAGPDTKIWFTQPWHDRIGQMAARGALALFTVPDAYGLLRANSD